MTASKYRQLSDRVARLERIMALLRELHRCQTSAQIDVVLNDLKKEKAK